MKKTAAFLILFVALSTSAAYAGNLALCPVSGKPLPTAEQRQFTVPAKLLPCIARSSGRRRRGWRARAVDRIDGPGDPRIEFEANFLGKG
ncbi:MAG TPA: hypothetical protein VGM86_32430 [Thermoanaerobaculia bacterium]|jgi:hypothetical protein